MKKFQFQLESVLNYRNQQLDALLVELDMAQARVFAQEHKRDLAYERLSDYGAEFSARKAEGLSIQEALEFEACQQVLYQRALHEQHLLDQRRSELEVKREEVIEKRKETHTLEHLKDTRRREYNAAAAKEDERALEDLTATRRVLAAS